MPAGYGRAVHHHPSPIMTMTAAKMSRSVRVSGPFIAGPFAYPRAVRQPSGDWASSTGQYVFQVHGIDAKREGRVRKRLRRSQVIAYFAVLPPRPIGMEACATSHHWAREPVVGTPFLNRTTPAFVATTESATPTAQQGLGWPAK
jgi:hypothetical protein